VLKYGPMLVLASNSPRRRQLLASGGWDFSVVAAQVDERVQPGELPDAYVLRLAENKARAAVGLLSPPVPHQTLIIAADTTVVAPDEDEKLSPALDANDSEFQPQILGKPADSQEAEAMLRRLRGRTHQVLTGLAVLRASDGRLLKDVCITDVSMRNYSDAAMMAYIASGDPLDKAGAYAIQHAEFRPVENLHGCYANVMGLPLCYLMRMLEAFDVPMDVDIAHSCQTTLDYPCSIFRQVLSKST
jgi:septum formation protein